MKVIGSDDRARTVLLSLTFDEWDELQQAAGVPYDKRSRVASAGADIGQIRSAIISLQQMKNFRKELGGLQKKWDHLASEIDVVLEK